MQTAARRIPLLETAIVGAVVLILAGILIPLIVAARERSNQEACADRLAVVGDALALYHNDHLAYPPAGPWARELAPLLPPAVSAVCPAQEEEVGSGYVYLLDGDQLQSSGDTPKPRSVVMYCPAHARETEYDAPSDSVYEGAFPVLRLNQVTEIVPARQVRILAPGLATGPAWLVFPE